MPSQPLWVPEERDRLTAGCSSAHPSCHLCDRYHTRVPPGLNFLHNFLSTASPFKNFNLIEAMEAIKSQFECV